MGDENPIRTLRDYSRPSHEGYRNTIELFEGNNVSEDQNQLLKDFLKLVDSLDLDVANRERTRLHLFQFSLRDQASNWLERLPAGSISMWEDLTTRFLAQFFLQGRTAKLRNDILMFQQHQGEYLSEARTPGGKLRDRNDEESWALLEDLALYDNESWNDPTDFAKPAKAISLPQDVSSTSDRRLIEFENQVQRLMEAHLAPKQPIQVNKITSSCERRLSILETQLGQQQDDMISKINLLWKAVSEKLDDTPIRNTTGNPTAQMNFASTNYPIKEELRGKGIKSPSKLLSPKYLSQSSLAEQNRNPSSPKRVHFVNSIIILNKEDEAKEKGSVKSSVTENKDHEMTVESEEEFEEETNEETEEEEEDNPKHFDTFPTVKGLGYHDWLLKNPGPPWVKAKIRAENLNNVKFSCMIGHFNKKQAYLDMESPINVIFDNKKLGSS
ncbi:MAK10-like protein [Tanacetum coccineum]